MFAVLGVLILTTAAQAQTYAVIEQDTHGMTLVAIESISSPTPTTRRFTTVSIDAWPQLWQGSYTQMTEDTAEVDCWTHRIRSVDEFNVMRDIRGVETGTGISVPMEGDEEGSPISDGFEAYEKFLCNGETTVSAAPFPSLENAKRYYFTWLNRNVPRIAAD